MPWVKYKYDCHFGFDGTCVCDLPNIEVALSKDSKSDVFTFLGLIDSGCQLTNVNSDIAKLLGINLSDCKTINVMGVTGSCLGYLSTLTMELKDLGGKFEAPVIFLDNLPNPILLGQNNFFDKFDIKFEKRNNTFELKRNDRDKK